MKDKFKLGCAVLLLLIGVLTYVFTGNDVALWLMAFGAFLLL